MALPRLRNPRQEASDRLPPGHVARVLEPSPPAGTDPEWMADDPTDPAGASGSVVVSPTSDGDLSWDEMVVRVPRLRAFAAAHWLGAHRRLAPLPAAYRQTRRHLHQLAFWVMAPARYQRTGKLGLRYTRGGFGTPFFDDDVQLRVEGVALVYQDVDAVRATDLTTLADAARFVGVPIRDPWYEGFRDSPGPLLPDAPLHIDARATDALGNWFGFATAVLEELRRTPEAAEVSRVQLWPEHFDLAVEVGVGDSRAAFGASPGDDAHPEPYLYVAPWSRRDRLDPYWNDEAFGGASLSYTSLMPTDERQYHHALAFLRRGHRLLAAEQISPPRAPRRSTTP